MRRLASLAIAALLIAACAQNPTVSDPRITLAPGVSPYPSTAPGASQAPTVTPAPTTTPAPLTKAQLAKLYLAAAKAYNKVEAKASKNLPNYPSNKQWKAYCRVVAKATKKFQDAVQAIAWPAEYKTDVRALLKADAKSELYLLDCAHARSTAALYEAIEGGRKPGKNAQAASNFLRHELGLPSVPIT